MKKSIAFSFAVLLIGLLFAVGCGSEKILAKPEDTNLEFWVAQDVSEYDFGSHYEVNGVFGAFVYYGTGYSPAGYTENGHFPIPPEHCVIYTVTNYPDYADEGNYVTRIEITDPEIYLYGFNCEASFDKFGEIFSSLGCEITTNNYRCEAVYGKTHIYLESYADIGKITVSVEVTNNTGIVY